VSTSARERFVGVWELRTIRDREAGGPEHDLPEFGPAPEGRLLYTDSGHVSVNFMRPGREPWAAEDQPSDLERSRAAAGYGAYAGRFTVLETEAVVRHHIEVALIPNRVGGELVRHYAFHEGGNRLTLRPPPFIREGRAIERALTWERIG
jgi:hypothetical protein